MALTLLRSTEEVRSKDAFCGRVDLPFLETRPPRDETALRMAWVPLQDVCVVYRIQDGVFTPVSQDEGLNGLVRGVGSLLQL